MIQNKWQNEAKRAKNDQLNKKEDEILKNNLKHYLYLSLILKLRMTNKTRNRTKYFKKMTK